MDDVSFELPVPEIIPYRSLEELEAERYRTEMRETRRLEEQRELINRRLEKKMLERKRAELPSYEGQQVDLLA